MPIYEGGEVYARTRQAKETVGQRRLEADSIRDQVRAAVISSWGQLEAARAQIIAAQAQVEAAETALNGVREEARVGQRTTLDVLNAQQELLNARVNLITAQRDRVVASYAVVQAIGPAQLARARRSGSTITAPSSISTRSRISGSARRRRTAARHDPGAPRHVRPGSCGATADASGVRPGAASTGTARGRACFAGPREILHPRGPRVISASRYDGSWCA